MKLIIDIPEEVYKAVLDGSYCGSLYEELLAAIPYNPTGDLISREALKEAISYHCEYLHDNTMDLEDILDLINHVSTVPLPDFKAGYKQAIIDGKTNFSRPQGEWIDHTATQNLLWGQYECPFCHKRSNRGASYCQYCGVQMQIGGAEE